MRNSATTQRFYIKRTETKTLENKLRRLCGQRATGKARHGMQQRVLFILQRLAQENNLSLASVTKLTTFSVDGRLGHG